MPRSIQGPVRRKRLLMQATLTLAIVVLLSVPRIGFAQHHGGGGAGGAGGFGGMGGGGMSGRGDMREGFPRGDMSRGNSSMHAGLQVGPPSRWWDDKHFVKQLKLSVDQQHRMDAIFEQSRPVLVKRAESLQQEEQKMEALTHAKTLDESALFSQIDRIEQARADLAKATTHYLLQLRNELDADQIAKLDQPQ